ncbi:MAG: hypothetical protein JRE28_01695 [Deltaproteobacteria bacterium]|nr:hypothetical protein [Deltaproteobacteria bacterium]
MARLTFSRALQGVGAGGNFALAYMVPLSPGWSMGALLCGQIVHFLPEIQSLFTENVQKVLREAVAEGVTLVFWISLITACMCLFFSYRLPE